MITADGAVQVYGCWSLRHQVWVSYTKYWHYAGQRGLSYRDIANSCHVSKSAVSRWGRWVTKPKTPACRAFESAKVGRGSR